MKKKLIEEIRKIAGISEEKFVEVSSPISGDFPEVMRYKRDQWKVQFDGERLLGLNLANRALTDEKWQQILKLPGFRLECLQALNLSENHLTDFPQAGKMKAMRWLNLSENQIRKFTLPPGMDRLQDLNLEENPLTFPTEEILKQGRAAVLRFLKDSRDQGVRKVYEVKMLIVGEGGTGKTTLWNLLQNSEHPVPDEDQESTVGIQIKEGWIFVHLDEPSAEFAVNLWDFGGQDIQYMTHQFFLTRRSFYVLLADGRREVANFSYWFKIINLLGTEVEMEHPLPVLVVLNERGNAIARLPYDPGTIKKDFPKLEVTKREVDFGKKDGRFAALKTEIQHLLCKHLPHLPLEIPVHWERVRKELIHLQKEKNHINSEEFGEICVQNGVENQQSQNDLSQLLHDLGVILHFHEDPTLADFIVLNPQWAANAVYEIMRHDEVVKENQGRFDKSLLRKVWIKCKFSDDEQNKLLNLMLKDNFEVCFRASERGKEIYIAPQLLSAQQPKNLEWRSELTSLRYTYQYPFMPKGIIGRLIVRLHEAIETRGGRKVVWEKGTILEKEDCRALIRETEDPNDGRKLIRIEIQGEKPENRIFVLRGICDELDRIHQRSFTSLKVFQKIPCCCAICSKDPMPFEHDYEVLKDMENKKVLDVQCNKSHEMVPVQLLLNGVFPEEGPGRVRNTKKPRSKQIYFSYAWKDADESGENREELVDELYTSLVDDGHEVLRDKMNLDYGELISEFMKDLGQGDLIVVFISDKYVKSPYCMNELHEIARNSKWDKRIFTERILPIPVEKIRFDDPDILDRYFDHWEEQEEKWESLMKKRAKRVSIAQAKRHQMVKAIHNEFGRLSDWLTDINAGTTKLLSEDDFERVKGAILSRFTS